VPQDGATFFLALGQNLNFSENSKSTVCAYDFENRKNSTTAYLYGECRCAPI